MRQNAQIIPFPPVIQKTTCCCCNFVYRHERGKTPSACSSTFDPKKLTITTGTTSSYQEIEAFEVSQDAIPFAPAGNICDTCIETMLSYGKIRNLNPEDEGPVSYEISFTMDDKAQTGYAFMCYDEAHWHQFMTIMRSNFDQPNLSASRAPRIQDFPCVVICRGISQKKGSKQQLQTEILAQACIFMNTG